MLPPLYSTENELICPAPEFHVRSGKPPTYLHTWLKQLQMNSSEILIAFTAHSSSYIIEMVLCQCGPNTLYWIALQAQNNRRINYFK